MPLPQEVGQSFQLRFVFDSVDDLSLAISLLRAASRRGDITIRRCKDRFGKPFENGYRDLQLNVELEGFDGELQ